MQFSAESFQSTVKYLETHQESLRIKKVIFCLCKKQWENNPNILERFSLAELLEEIVEKTSSFQEIETAINKLIDSLNNTNFYVNISEIILNQLRLVYDPEYSHFSEIPTQINLQQFNFNSSIDSIVEELANHKQKRRIKKLIVSACQSKWEKDSGIVRKHDFRDLILELYNLNPQKADLEKSLYKIVKKLNKSEIYSQISTLVIDRLAVLYETEKKSTANPTICCNPDQSTLEIQKPPNDGNIRLETELDQKFNFAELPASYDLFELRLEIMQYTNPLHAKMILLALLDQFWIQYSQDWSILRNFTLDYLLEQVLKIYKSKEEVQNKFEQISPLLPVPEFHKETTKILLEIIQNLL